MKKITSLFSNEYVFALLTRFVHIALAMAQSICTARYLGPELKGNSAYISSIVSMGSIIITFGMHQAYPYFKKKYSREIFFDRYMSLIYIIYAAYFILSIVLCFFELPIDIKMAILLMPLYGYNCVVAYVSLIENPNRRNKISVFVMLFFLMFTVTLMLTTKSSYGWMVVLLIICHLIESIYFTTILKSKLIYDKRSLHLLKELVMFGFFPMLALLMTTLNYKIDVLMLKQYQFITYGMIGVYSLGIGLAEKIVIIPDTLKGVLVSKLAKGAPSTEVARICRLCMISGLVVFALLSLCGQWLINILYGQAYSGAYRVLLITSMGVIFIGYFKLIAQYNIVNGKQVRNVFMLSVAIIVNVVGNLILVPKFGINGAAIATGLGNLVCGLVFVFYFSITEKIPVRDMFVLKKNDLTLIKQLINK